MWDRRLNRLEKRQEREASFENVNAWYEFLVAPSCPPDKRLHIRGGTVTPTSRWGFIIQQSYIEPQTCDFEDTDATDLSLNFSNAGYYLPLILCFYGDWLAYRTLGPAYEDPVYDNVVGTEVATTVEAEAQLDSLLNGSNDWFDYKMPLYGVVLKNDGDTDSDAAILAIDAVNRGRSYLYRDARARNCLIE